MNTFLTKPTLILDDPRPCTGRLTLTSGTPVPTSDQSAKTTLYWTPYDANLISLYNGTIWKTYEFSELSISVPATTDTNYDAFIYDNSGTLTIELVAWTNDTTRATALTTQDGIHVKSGATGRRYVGTVRTTGTSGQIDDTFVRRFVWNEYNHHPKLVKTTYTSGHTYTTASNRAWNNNTTIGEARVAFVQGHTEQHILAECYAQVYTTGTGDEGWVGIGVNSTTGLGDNPLYFYDITSTQVLIYGLNANTYSAGADGYNYLNATQLGAANSLTYYQIGLYARLWA